MKTPMCEVGQGRTGGRWQGRVTIIRRAFANGSSRRSFARVDRTII